VDLFLLVTIAGAGDELQGIKRGVMELADVVVVNKADGDNMRASERTRAETESALHFLPSSASGWLPRAMTCSAKTGHGVADVWSCVLEYAQSTEASGQFEQRRREQARLSMQENLESALMQLFRSDPTVQKHFVELEERVLSGRITAVTAVRELLAAFLVEKQKVTNRDLLL
jgi:LAO/AO transport system kinase